MTTKMSAEDLAVKALIVQLFHYFIGIAFLLFIIKRYGNTTRLWIYAWMLNAFITFVNKRIYNRKQELFSPLEIQKSKLGRGRKLQILEVGSGGGANFGFFPTGSEVTCLEPNPHFKVYIEENVPPEIHVKEIRIGFGEDMKEAGFEDDTFDAIVMTLVLCSVNNMEKVLSEIKRVLKPDGRLYFLEHHIGDNGTIMQKIQKILNPFWVHFADGCELTRDIPEVIKKARFNELQMQKFKFPSLLTYIIRPFCMGTAKK